MKSCLIVFAKEPENGKVKTRLQEIFTEEECSKVYKAFLEDTLDLAAKVQCDSRILAYHSEGEPLYIKEIAGELSLYRQEGKDLGERMFNAFKYFCGDESCKTVIIGSDSPTLPTSYITEAFKQLETNDIVIGPSRDGGYYLIGLKTPFYGLFEGIEWGSNTVLESTLEKAEKARKGAFLLGEWYDIDTVEDIENILKDPDGTSGKVSKELLKNGFYREQKER